MIAAAASPKYNAGMCRWSSCIRSLAVGFIAVLLAGCAPVQGISGSLVVFNAGSLALPMRDLLRAFQAEHPGIRPAQESSGSLEAARKLTELQKIPDVLAVADQQVIPSLLVPSHATWFIAFARNAMVLAYHARAPGAGQISADNWPDVLLTSGVRVGRAEPALDPAGYRAVFAYQLAEARWERAGLADSLLAASPARFVRAKSSDLAALVQAGELDYAWMYRSAAQAAGIPYVELGPEIDLSDPGREAWYGQAEMRLPGVQLRGDSISVRGEPIVFAMTIPTGAPNRLAAEAFVRFALSPAGRQVIRDAGFIIIDPPVLGGPGRPPEGLFLQP